MAFPPPLPIASTPWPKAYTWASSLMEWEHKSFRGVVGSTGFLSSHSLPILCPSFTQYALLGKQPPPLPLLLWHLYFPISAMWGPATILLQLKIICFWRWKLETLQPAGQGFHLWPHDFSDKGHQIWHLISLSLFSQNGRRLNLPSRVVVMQSEIINAEDSTVPGV